MACGFGVNSKSATCESHHQELPEAAGVPSEVSPSVPARPGPVSLMRSDEIIAWGGNGFCEELRRFREWDRLGSGWRDWSWHTFREMKRSRFNKNQVGFLFVGFVFWLEFHWWRSGPQTLRECGQPLNIRAFVRISGGYYSFIWSVPVVQICQFTPHFPHPLYFKKALPVAS